MTGGGFRGNEALACWILRLCVRVGFVNFAGLLHLVISM